MVLAKYSPAIQSHGLFVVLLLQQSLHNEYYQQLKKKEKRNLDLTACPSPTILILSWAVKAPFPLLRPPRIPAVVMVTYSFIFTIFMLNISPTKARFSTFCYIFLSDVNSFFLSKFIYQLAVIFLCCKICLFIILTYMHTYIHVFTHTCKHRHSKA